MAPIADSGYAQGFCPVRRFKYSHPNLSYYSRSRGHVVMNVAFGVFVAICFLI